MCQSHQKADWTGELSEEMLSYAAEDARVLLPLHKALEERIFASGQKRTLEIEERALLAGIEMAHNGVWVDKGRWLGIVERAGEGLEVLRARLDDLVGDPPEGVRERNVKNKGVPAERTDRWNWDSADQIKAAARSVGLRLEKTSMDHLKLVDHELARALVGYKEVKSGLTTYGVMFFEPTEDGGEVYVGGRLYPSWKMCEADTGRMSCAQPNVQNVPSKTKLRELRKCVVAPEGRRLIKADYSQIELRIVAKVAGEEAMLEAFRRGVDIHSRTAQSIVSSGGDAERGRRLAKGLNFGLLYGMGAKKLREKLESDYGVVLSLEEATPYRERWFGTYPAIRRWHREEGTSFEGRDGTARAGYRVPGGGGRH
jgi:DNA polymerase-1